MMRERTGKMEINITHGLSEIGNLRRVARKEAREIDAWCNAIHDLRTEKSDRRVTA